MFNFGAADVQNEPFPHVSAEPFLDPGLYDRLRREFPADALFDSSSTEGGRSGRDLYRGDAEMSELLSRSPAWNEFHSYLNSPEFLDFTLSLFGDRLGDLGCTVDPEDMTFVDWTEPRGDLAAKRRSFSLARKREGSPEEMYCRLDVHQGGASYAKPVHCDRPNRLVSMIIYFVDAEEIQCRGGDLGIHKSTSGASVDVLPRHPKPDTTEIVTTITPTQNRGLFFPCSNNSYHSVSAIESTQGYRDFAYINLSSRSKTIWG